MASVKSGLSDHRTLVVKLVIVTPKEEIVTQATLDTGSEVDIVSPDFARRLWHAGARYGDRGGCIKVIGGGVVQLRGPPPNAAFSLFAPFDNVLHVRA